MSKLQTVKFYLDKAKELCRESHGIVNDEKLAHWVGASRTTMQKWKRTDTIPAEPYAIELALLLNMNPLTLLLAMGKARDAHAGRETKIWDQLAKHVSDEMPAGIGKNPYGRRDR